MARNDLAAKIVAMSENRTNKLAMAITFALHDEGFGKVRIKRIAEQTQYYLDMFDKDKQADVNYARHKFDERLKEIMGDEPVTLKTR